jgi:TP901 family phage tail tape measure protein
VADRSIVARFDAKIDGYLGNVAKMSAATEKFAKSASASATKHKADWDKIGKAAIVGGAAIGAVVVGAAKAYADFEQAMSGVGAVADANARQMEQLSTAAIKAGQDTVFSASEAAKAEAELAKAGVSVNDILQGGLIGSINLAAAGQIDLAKSAEISAQAMNIFNLRGSDVGHIADVLTAGANKSAAGVDDLGQALQQGGLLAKQTGLSLEDTVGVLSAFADNALKGSDAGTSLKTMLQRLTPQSKEQAAAMDDLGLKFYDANGQFVGITEAADRMRKAFAGLTPEQRNSAMATIFGSDAVRGANILYEQGAAGIRQYINAVDDQGAAARMAAKQMDNLKGDVEQLKGSLETAFIQGGKGGNAGLRSVVQSLTSLVNKFGELSPATQAAVVKTAAVVSGLLLLTGGTMKAVAAFQSFRTSLERVGISQEKQIVGAKNLAKALIAVGTAAAVSKIGNDDNNLGANKLTKDLLSGSDAAKSLAATWTEAAKRAQGFDSPIRSLGDALDVALKPSKLQQMDDAGGKLLATFGGSNLSDMEFARQRFTELDGALSQLVSSGRSNDAQKAFSSLAAAAQASGFSVEQLKAQLPQYQEALDGAAVSATGAADATSGLPPVAEAAAKTAQDAADSTKAWADALNGLNSPALDARAAARAFEEAVDGVTSSIKDNGKTLDIHTEKGRKNQAALDAVAKAAIDQIGALQANGASQGSLQKTLDTSRDRLIKAAMQFGMTKAQAKKYADQVLQIPASKTTTATFRTVGLTALQQAGQYLKDLHDKHITLTVGTVKVGNTKVNAGQFAGGGGVEGPGTGTSDSVPALLSNGEHVWTAAEVQAAGGQQAMYRARALVRGGALRFAKGGAVGFADGGEVDFSAILSIIRDVTTSDDLTSARNTAGSRARAVTAAVNALRALQAQQRAVRRSLSGATGAERANLLDRQRLLLGKVAAAEGKLAAARQASTAAARNAIAVEKEYAADHRPIIDRAISATSRTNTSSKAFLDNIDKLTRMGFRTLALDLLSMGSEDASGIAAQAAQSAAKARALQSQFAASSSLSAREAALKASLSGASSSMSAATPVGVGSSGSLIAGATTVYVQNPFTGDYLEARIDARADGRVATAAASARRKVG